jgi:hypothetical protein
MNAMKGLNKFFIDRKQVSKKQFQRESNYLMENFGSALLIFPTRKSVKLLKEKTYVLALTGKLVVE